MFTFFCFVHGKGHIIWLMQPPSSDDHPPGTLDGTEVREFIVHGKGYQLTILPVLLDPPDNHDGGNGFNSF